MILAVVNAIYAIAKPEKNSGLQQDLNPCPRDAGGCSNQLSYETTDVGSWSIMCLLCFRAKTSVASLLSWLKHRTVIAKSRIQIPLKS